MNALPPAPEPHAITVHYTGHESCRPGHSFGPAVRQHFLLHFVVRGCGTLKKKDAVFPVNVGQGFLIAPGETTTYCASMEDPWEYYWVGFSGSEAAALLSALGICPGSPVFAAETAALEPYLRHLAFSASQNAAEHALSLTGDLYYLFSVLAAHRGAPAGQQTRGAHIRRALSYIEQNYGYPITVQAVADAVGLSRSHLYRLFLAETGIGAQNYLLHYRLRQACTMLSSSQAPVEQICYSCGFTDVNHFTKIFKRKIGLTPGRYRKTVPPESALLPNP